MQDLKENKIPTKKCEEIAKDTRIILEEKTGKKVVSGENFLPKNSQNKKIKNE